MFSKTEMTPIPRDPEWGDMLERCVEGALYTPGDASAEVTRVEKTSERMSFLSAFWIMALENAREKGLPPGSPEAWDIVEEAGDIGGEISFLYQLSAGLDEAKSGNPDKVREANRLRTKFYGDPISALKHRPQNYPPADDLEHAAARYFDSTWRSPEIDRFVLRLLLEREVAMFLHEMARDDLLTDGPSKLAQAQATLRRTGFGQSFKVTLWVLVALAAIVGLTMAFPSMPTVVPIAASGAVLILGTTWLGLVIYAFAFHGRRAKERAQKTIDLVSMGVEVLQSNNGNGPIAISEFRRDLERLRDAGFDLPQTLFGMIDEYEKEGVVRL